MSNPIEPENEVPAADRGGDAKSLPESSPAKTHSTRLRACDPFALAQASPLVASIMPGDPLDALTFEYRTLATLAETTGTTPLQRGHYASCLEVCEAYDVAKFRRDLALLLVWSGKLYRLEYSSFREFAKEKANLSRSQAYKAALGALMLLLFDSAGKRHLKPAGDFEAELVKLMPDHWVPAWDAVLAQAPADPELDQVRIELHRYGEGHPSALRVKRQEPGTYLGRLSTLPSSDPPDPPPVHHELELALSQTEAAARIAAHARSHRGPAGPFVLAALRAAARAGSSTLPPSPSSKNLPVAELLQALRKADPTAAALAEKAATAGLLAFIEDACAQRHRSLESRKAEYLRRRARKRKAAAP